MSKATESAKPALSKTHPAFRFRKSTTEDTADEQKAGYVMRLFATAEDEAEAEALEPGVHNWFNNPKLKVETPNATVADIQAEMEGQITKLAEELESAKSINALQTKQIAAQAGQIESLTKELKAATEGKKSK